MAKLGTATAAQLRRKMYRAVRQLKADSHGWIHGLNPLLRSQFQLTTSQTSHQLVMMVQEGLLERRGIKSQLYRVLPPGHPAKKHQQQPQARARRVRIEEVPPSRIAEILKRVASVPGVQELVDREIAKLEDELETLRALKRSPV